MEKEIYDKKFDYEDMKVAMVVSDFYNDHEEEMSGYELFEDIIELCVEIRKAWNNLEKYKDCNIEEYAFIQFFAERYLIEKFLGGK